METEIKKTYEIYAGDTGDFIEKADLSDEDARYKSANGFILQLVGDEQ